MASTQPETTPITKRLAARLGASVTALCGKYERLDDRTHHVLGILLKVGIGIYFVFCALSLTARYVVWPHIENYKGDIEKIASKAIGNPVSISGIRASWDGMHPRLTLDQVVVREKNGRVALTLPAVSATLSWWSIPTIGLRLRQLEISRPDLDIRRDPKGNVYVAGLLFDSANADDDGDGADWVLQQDEIVIHDGKLRWNDEMRKAPELALQDVHIVLQNQGWHHSFMLNAKPPAQLSAPLDVRADFRHPFFASSISDVRQWSGTLFADVRNTDLTAWKAYFDYPFELNKGYGSVRAWLTLDHARVANFTADLALSDVVARLRGDLEPLDLREVSGRISAREDYDPERASGVATLGAQGHAVAVTDLTLTTRDGLVLPKTTVSEEYTPRSGSEPEKTAITTRELDLQTLAKFVRFLPMTAEQRKILSELAPSGQLKDFSVQWQGSYPDLVSYQVRGEFAGLTLKAQPPRAARAGSSKQIAQAAIPGIPGFENLSGRIEANQKGGDVSLASEKLVLHFPGYYRESAVPFESLKLRASWEFLPKKEQFEFKVSKADFVQEGIVGSLSGKHTRSMNLEDKSSGSIDLSGKLSGFDVTRIGRYLPLQTPENLRQWLVGALEQGQAKEVQFKVRGALSDFPFAERRDGKRTGEFMVTTQLENVTLNYSPGDFAKDRQSPLWPQAEAIQGRLSVNGARMEIWADTAKTANVALQNVSAIIPDLLSKDRQLEIEGHAAGALQDFVRYTHRSPVGEWIGNFTEDTKGSGNAKLLLKFQLPLERKLEAKVQGFLEFDNNDIHLLEDLPVLTNAKGKLEFFEKGFRLHDIRAGFLGGSATISGGTQNNGKFAVKANGHLTVDGVRKAFPKLPKRISGKMSYALSINERGRQPDIVLESGLRGIVLDYPAPLKKAANDALPLGVRLSALAPVGGNLRDELRLTLGSAISARYQRQKSTNKGSRWDVLRGGIGVNVPPPDPVTGLAMKVALREIEVDEWQRALGSVVGSKRAEKTQPTGGVDVSAYVDPDKFSAKTPKLTVSGLEFDQVELLAEQLKESWQIGIKSDQATGVINWIAAGGKQKKDRIAARLTALNIPQSATSDTGSLLEISTKPSQMPDLDIVADNFVMRGKKLGHLELAATSALATSGREWNIEKLVVSNPDAVLKASVTWTARKSANATKIHYTLDVKNAGKLLDRVGFPDVIKDGKGKSSGSMAWNGTPFALDKPSLSGQMTLDLEKGQFLKAEPGVARLLGVLSLQTLPRRLMLDFRDIFSKGYAFDKINATANMNKGTIKTDNLKMLGASSTVLMGGSADIVNETQNLHVVVVPEVSPNVASAVYGAIVNPVIGVGSVLAQLVFSKPLSKILTYEYQITGAWDNPTIKKITQADDASKASSPTEKNRKGSP